MRHAIYLALALPALVGISAPQAHAQLKINATFDSSITSDANAATIESSINSALSVYETTFTNPLTVNIDFAEGGGLGESSTAYNQVSYTDYRQALINAKAGSGDTAFLSYLPNTAGNPVNGSGFVNVTSANLRLLGLSTDAPTFDSTITLNTSIMNLSRTGTQDSSKYDLLSTVSHEMDEALGIGSSLTSPDNFFNNNAIRGLDLYRYASQGVYSFTTDPSATPYLSVDGGKTAVLDQYGNPVYFNQSGGGADYNDFASPSNPNDPRVQDAFGSPGIDSNLGPAEFRALEALGYNIAAVPEASSSVSLGLLFALGLGVMVVARKRKTASKSA